MQDPVLYGSEGHSFERAALEQWLAANPGVHPISRQPLLPGEGRDVLPNDALRNMIQQMHAAT
jgi:U-box domain